MMNSHQEGRNVPMNLQLRRRNAMTILRKEVARKTKSLLLRSVKQEAKEKRIRVKEKKNTHQVEKKNAKTKTLKTMAVLNVILLDVATEMIEIITMNVKGKTVLVGMSANGRN